MDLDNQPLKSTSDELASTCFHLFFAGMTVSNILDSKSIVYESVLEVKMVSFHDIPGTTTSIHFSLYCMYDVFMLCEQYTQTKPL